jgi:hypothetical protein
MAGCQISTVPCGQPQDCIIECSRRQHNQRRLDGKVKSLLLTFGASTAFHGCLSGPAGAALSKGPKPDAAPTRRRDREPKQPPEPNKNKHTSPRGAGAEVQLPAGIRGVVLERQLAGTHMTSVFRPFYG